jgi:hypothetical protein
MKAYDISEGTSSLLTLGDWKWKANVTFFFIRHFKGHYNLFVRGKFFQQILKDGTTNQALQSDISHMHVLCANLVHVHGDDI